VTDITFLHRCGRYPRCGRSGDLPQPGRGLPQR